MSTEQEDRGVDPEAEDLVMTDEGLVEAEKPPHVLDALGNPAAPEDDLGGD